MFTHDFGKNLGVHLVTSRDTDGSKNHPPRGGSKSAIFGVPPGGGQKGHSVFSSKPRFGTAPPKYLLFSMPPPPRGGVFATPPKPGTAQILHTGWFRIWVAHIMWWILRHHMMSQCGNTLANVTIGKLNLHDACNALFIKFY